MLQGGSNLNENTNALSKDYKCYENMVAHMIYNASRRNGVRGILFNDFLSGLLDECEVKYVPDTPKPITLLKSSKKQRGVPISSAKSEDMSQEYVAGCDLLKGYAALAKLCTTRIPFLAPPNVEWPQCILAINREIRCKFGCPVHCSADACSDKHSICLDNSCKFGHFVRAANADRCDIYVCDMDETEPKSDAVEGEEKRDKGGKRKKRGSDEMEEKRDDKKGAALFLCECTYRSKPVTHDVMKQIIDGLEKAWENTWALVFVFCVKLAVFREEWERKDIGCVNIDCRDRCAQWVYEPAEGDRKKLVIVMETGEME